MFLAQCHIWHCDGTFKTAPKLFQQSYTIHGKNNYSMKPFVFAALTNKYETTYVDFLENLLLYANNNSINLSPSSILIDFEQGAMNAFKKVFPNATILFCQFHYAKNIIKHVRKLRKLYIRMYVFCINIL